VVVQLDGLLHVKDSERREGRYRNRLLHNASWDNDSAVNMRFAGTWSRYSNIAVPDRAATLQGLAGFFRCAGQANVMMTLHPVASPPI
jgi:hypothetical protein